MKTTPSRVLASCLCVLLLASVDATAKRGGGGGNSHPVPILSFQTVGSDYAVGDPVHLSWASVDTRFCQASGDWDGRFDTSGSYMTPPIDGSKTYHLKCSSKGGGVTGTIYVKVAGGDPVPAPVPAPTLVLSALDPEVEYDGSTTLSWITTDATGCTASDDWSGSYGPEGSRLIGPLQNSGTYSLECTGDGGSISSSVWIAVGEAPPPPAPEPEPTPEPEPEPTPIPTVSITAADSRVNSGGYTTLSWSSTDAQSCEAGGGWYGARSPSGSELVGPIDTSTTFTLSCVGAGGSAMQMVAVSALGQVQITWIKPNENVDGSPLNDLMSYRIYFGPKSGDYTGSVDVMDPNATDHAFSAESGEYFVTMTALDADGNESTFSNEILRTVP